MNTTILTIFITITITLLGAWYIRSMTYAESREIMSEKTAETGKTAYFAGGCFWCTESDFEKVPGVLEAVSGYAGGHVKHPSYKQVSAGNTGHVESVKVIYDPSKISYNELLDAFWRHVDPTDGGGQFVDRGSQYRSVIFYTSDTERDLAEKSKRELAASGKFSKPIATDILPLTAFYPAEEYHQDYYKKNPIRYRFYRSRSGRDQFLKKTWPDEMNDNMSENRQMMPEKKQQKYMRKDDAVLKIELTSLQYKVVRKNGTEPAFKNTYWNNHEPGIYVDIVSGEPLFSSADKFDSGTGWPSFTRPLEPDNVVTKEDNTLFMTRTEVRSKYADSHLGHVFSDGPAPTGLRYCINSASLRFIAVKDLEKEGYGQYRKNFK